VEKLGEFIDYICRRLTCIVYLIVVILGVLQVGSRYLFNYPIIWVDELSKYLFIWLIFLGVALASKRKAHFVADFFVVMFPKKMQAYLDVVARILSLVFLGVCVWITPNLMKITQNSISATVGIPLSYVYAGMLVGFFLTLLVEIIDFHRVYFAKPRQGSHGSEKSC